MTCYVLCEGTAGVCSGIPANPENVSFTDAEFAKADFHVSKVGATSLRAKQRRFWRFFCAALFLGIFAVSHFPSALCSAERGVCRGHADENLLYRSHLEGLEDAAANCDEGQQRRRYEARSDTATRPESAHISGELGSRFAAQKS